MKEFLWKIAGADLQILHRSSEGSKKVFFLIGLYLLFVMALFYAGAFIFFSSFGFSWVSALLIAAAFLFVFAMIYGITLITLEPNVLPHKVSLTVWISHGLRIMMLLMFAFFIACPLTCLFEELMMGDLEKVFNSSQFISDMRNLFNQTDFYVFFTLVSILFLLPVFIKYFERGKDDYYGIKKMIDRNEIVEPNYEDFKAIYKATFLAATGSSKEYTELYENPPYNTKRKKDSRDYSSKEEFLTQILG